MQNDMDLEPLNLGMIAAYYYITYTTIELFSSSLTARTKLKVREAAPWESRLVAHRIHAFSWTNPVPAPGQESSAVPPCLSMAAHVLAASVRHVAHRVMLSDRTWGDLLPLQGLLEILSAASEFDEMPVRPGEEDVVRRLLTHAPVAVDKPRFTDPHVKTNSLLQVRPSPCHGLGMRCTLQCRTIALSFRPVCYVALTSCTNSAVPLQLCPRSHGSSTQACQWNWGT